MTVPLPAEFQRKPAHNILVHFLGRLFFRVTGWKIKGEMPNIPKFVIAAAPHTSNMDGILLLACMGYLRIRFDFMIKKELTRGPLKWFVRLLGGLPIDRSAHFNTVDQVVHQIEKRDSIILVVAPEGTRRKTEYWKTGFYWIAYNAQVPILCAGVDYPSKVIDLTGPLFVPSGDIEADLEQVWAFHRTMTGRHPEKTSTMRLKPSDTQPLHKLPPTSQSPSHRDLVV